MRIIGNERGFFIPLTLTVIGVAPIEIALIAALHIKSFGLIFLFFRWWHMVLYTMSCMGRLG